MITLLAPTLQDLLNPESANGNSILDMDPYGAAFLEDDDKSEDDLENDIQVTVTRSGALAHLKIDSIINLAKPKLITYFNQLESASSTFTKAPATQVTQKTSQKWLATNANWATRDDFDFEPVTKFIGSS